MHTVKEGETKPRLIDQEITGGNQFRNGPRSKLLPPKKSPTDQERKKLIAIAVSWLVRHTMTKFLYTFGGEDFKQSTGGPTGDEITQAMSRHLGNEYDENFLEKFENINIKIELFDRNVDDQDIALGSFGKRVKFCHLDGELVPKTDVEIEDPKRYRRIK